MNLSELVTQVQCFGEANGSIDLSVSGGAAPFTYQWNTGANTQDLADIPAGAYTVTVTDMNDCTASSLVTVTEPASMAFNIVSLSNTCSSETLTGPIGPNLVYMWTGPGIVSATTTAVTVYNSGVYTLVITNPTGCTASSSYTVNLSGNSTCGAIKGRIFHDTDESCSLNGTEPGLAGWIVRAVSSTDTVYDVTDSQGRYLMAVPLGTYTLKVIVPNLLWNVCPGGAPVNVTVGDTIAGGDFPVQAVYTCPALTVNIGDLLEYWSGYRWPSGRHRVLPPQPHAPEEDLVSLIYFYEANHDALVTPLEPPVGKVAGLAPVTCSAFIKERLDAITVG